MKEREPRMLFDCDVHNKPPCKENLLECLDEPYRTEFSTHGKRFVQSGIRLEDGGYRRDIVSVDGKIGGMDPVWTSKNLLDTYNHTYALLSGSNSYYAGVPDPDYVAAMCRAINDCVIKFWLPVDNRYLTGIHVPINDPLLAVKEIERLGDHPKVVAVIIAATAHRIPIGQRYYWPVYEACERKGLPVYLHPSTTAGIANHATMPSGMATNYLQSHVCLPQFFMSDLVSLVLEGVFEKFPGLKVVFVEGGVCWLPHVLWRMDKEYISLRQQAPNLKRLPSRYVRDHIAFTTQPIEEPDKIDYLIDIFTMIDADNTVMYASDYPHFDFDEPKVIPKQLGKTTVENILFWNAVKFFGIKV